MRRSLFRFDSVTIRSGVSLRLSDFSMELYEGEIAGVFGYDDSGKTAICRVLAGRENVSRGQLLYRGREMGDHIPLEIARHVELIEGNVRMASSLRVYEFEAMFDSSRRKILFHRRLARKTTMELLRSLGIDLSPDAHVGDLTAAQMHLLLIARAVMQGDRLLILNNTLNLYTESEWEQVKNALLRASGRGVAVLITSNRLPRLTEICRHISVLGGGTCLKVLEPAAYALLERRQAYRGEDISPSSCAEDQSGFVFEMRGLRLSGAEDGCSFSVRRGEVLGVYDPGNTVCTELYEMLQTMAPEGGEFFLEGKRLRRADIRKNLKQGIGFFSCGSISEELLPSLSAVDNILCPLSVGGAPAFMIFRRVRRFIAREYAVKLGVREEDMWEPAERFGGLEQLRIYLSRWEFLPLKMLVCRGMENLDEKAAEEVVNFFRTLAARGVAVMVLSYNIDLLRAVCGRICDLGGKYGSGMEEGGTKKLKADT